MWMRPCAITFSGAAWCAASTTDTGRFTATLLRLARSSTRTCTQAEGPCAAVRAGYAIVKVGIQTAAAARVRLLIATSTASHSLNVTGPSKVLVSCEIEGVQIPDRH